MTRSPMTAAELFTLDARTYERAVRALLHKAGFSGYNPLGGESDDVDVSAVFSDTTHEMRPVGRLRVFRHASGAVDVVSRVNNHPWAYTVIPRRT